ncbi:MAG TPA: helix-turn-helix transcriptional regulator [Pseudonocardiaceae bacterium]|jgi:transcriptional regulator with XRE-family HTH domain|nr:helix-turn-helix transcriptional regulator [Pseudonocardiaceae bacterium]
MDDREPTIRSRTLGEGLRRAMESAGVSGKTVADRIGCSGAHISRLLSGKRGATVEDVTSILTICGIRKGAERSYLLSLCEDPHHPGWFQQHGSRLPKQMRVLVDSEDLTDHLVDFQPLIIPGLLQVADYARAVISKCVNVPADEVEDRVAARLARAEVLNRRNPASFEFFIHEWVLRSDVGSRAIMSEQMHHLLRLGVREHVSIGVIPAALGAYAGMSGPFMMLHFPRFRPIVYLESETSCLFLEQPEEIHAYRNVLGKLRETSLGEGQSRDLIAELATKLSADGGADDDQG